MGRDTEGAGAGRRSTHGRGPSRRPWAATAGAGLAAVVVLGACGGDAEAPPSGAETAALAGDFCGRVTPAVDAWLAEASAEHPVPDDPRYGGTAVVASVSELPEGMNAFTSPDYGAVQHQQFVNLMTLVAYDEEQRLQPYLAESWEVAPDGSSITFHLRPDVVWHDGQPTDAEDVAFTYRRATDPATPFPNPAMWDNYEKGSDGVEVVDAHTVRIRLRPHADFMDAWTNLAVMPEHLLGDVPPEQLAGHPFGTRCPVGNGPFVFREHREGERWMFAANPAFPEALGGRPYLDAYGYRVVPDQNTLLSELLAGSIDVYLSPRPEQAEAIEADPDLELRNYTSRNAVFVAWNSRRPALADPRVRRALTMAADRQGMVDGLLEGFGSVAEGRIPPFHWAHGGQATGLSYDPAGARALLDEAGWSDRNGDGVRESADGTPLRLTIKVNTGSRQRGAVAQILQANLGQIGVDVDVQILEWAALLSQIGEGPRDFDAVVMAFVTNFAIDDSDLFHSSRVDGPYAWSGTENAELDRIMEALATAFDRAEAGRLWSEYERVLSQEQPFTFLYFPDRLDGINRRLQNVEMDARGEWINVREWWFDPDGR